MEIVIEYVFKYFAKKYPEFFNTKGRQKTIHKWKEEIIDNTKRHDHLDAYWVTEFGKQFGIKELIKYDPSKTKKFSLFDKQENSKILKIMLNSTLDSYKKT